MEIVTCDTCGDRVVIAAADETVTEGETPLEHLDRTGHTHTREPQLTACANCGFAWYYTGTADRATCPNCKTKVEPGHVPDEVPHAFARADSKSAE